jgi:hypothetical protein
MAKKKIVLKSEIVQACRNASLEAIKSLVNIAKDENATASARVAAATTIVDFAINAEMEQSFQELAFLSEVEEVEHTNDK